MDSGVEDFQVQTWQPTLKKTVLTACGNVFLAAAAENHNLTPNVGGIFVNS